MTATTRSRTRDDRPRNRPIRFSSMESLGFSNPSSIWSDHPIETVRDHRGRHEAPPPEPDTVADWAPSDVEDHLPGRDFRWSVVLISLLVIGTLGGVGYWLYQRPAIEAQASVEALTSQAADLLDALTDLESFNMTLSGDGVTDQTGLSAVDEAARSLFDTSGSLAAEDTGLRSAAATASASALDAVRLTREATSYRSAVTPVLDPPQLETDPNLVALDEAARDFGTWQLQFDETRTALPDGAMSATTEQLDILSGDLATILGHYMDALRQDAETEAVAVLDDLRARLEAATQQMNASLVDIQGRVSERIAEATRALGLVLD